MIQFLTGQAVMMNNILRLTCGQIAIPCDVEVQGIEWLVPIIYNGRLNGYDRAIQTTKPSPDSIKTIRVLSKGKRDTYWIAINDADGIKKFTDNCDGCCGDTPAMDAVTIPVAITEDRACADDTGHYTYYFALPPNPNGFDYLVSDSYNGAYGTPAYVLDTAIDTPAEVLTWFQANRGNSGANVWSLVSTNKILKLVSTNVVSAGVNITLNPATFCMPIPSTATTFDSVTIGGVSVPVPATTLSRLNPQAVIDRLRDYMPGMFTIITLASPNDFPHIQFTGKVVPTVLQLAGVTKGTFAAGAC